MEQVIRIKLTPTQIQLVELLRKTKVHIVRPHGIHQACRLSDVETDKLWRRQHGNRPLQAHTVAALTCVGILIEEQDEVNIIYRLAGESSCL